MSEYLRFKMFKISFKILCTHFSKVWLCDITRNKQSTQWLNHAKTCLPDIHPPSWLATFQTSLLPHDYHHSRHPSSFLIITIPDIPPPSWLSPFQTALFPPDPIRTSLLPPDYHHSRHPSWLSPFRTSLLPPDYHQFRTSLLSPDYHHSRHPSSLLTHSGHPSSLLIITIPDIPPLSWPIPDTLPPSCLSPFQTSLLPPDYHHSGHPSWLSPFQTSLLPPDYHHSGHPSSLLIITIPDIPPPSWSPFSLLQIHCKEILQHKSFRQCMATKSPKVQKNYAKNLSASPLKRLPAIQFPLG